jgi:hypothetical protein
MSMKVVAVVAFLILGSALVWYETALAPQSTEQR